MQYWIVGIVGSVVAVGLGVFLRRLDAKRYESIEKEKKKDDK